MRTFTVPEVRRPTRPRQAAAVLCCLLCLAGCEKVGDQVSELYDSKLPLDQPEDWWHQLQGGMIAEQRPPPPGVADPYPNLDLVPPRPTPTDAATRRKLLADLAAQRDSTKQAVAQQPIVWPVPGAPTPPQPASPQAGIVPGGGVPGGSAICGAAGGSSPEASFRRSSLRRRPLQRPIPAT